MGAARLYRGPTPGRAWVLADCNVPLGALDVSYETELVHLFLRTTTVQYSRTRRVQYVVARGLL